MVYSCLILSCFLSKLVFILKYNATWICYVTFFIFQFLETVQFKYFEEAKAKGIYIVGACGFDSIPCDVGLEFLRKKFDGDYVLHSF